MKRVLIAFFASTMVFLGFSPATIQAWAVTAENVSVWSEGGELSANDEQFLKDETAKLELPAEVKQVDYITFSNATGRYNDYVLEHAKAERPELLSSDQKKWAPGHLIVTVGVGDRHNGIYCGDDVCSALGLTNESKHNSALDDMKPSFKKGNYAAGLLEGTKGSAKEYKAANPWLIGGLIAGGIAAIGAFIGGILAFVMRKNRKTQIADARKEFDFVSQNHGRIAQQLDAIDIRAHSLTSVLADDQLRRDWDDIRNRFLSVHDRLMQFELTPSSDDKTFLAHRKDISAMHKDTKGMEIAEKNIDDLYKIEHGDIEVRRREAYELRSDIRRARAKASEPQQIAELDRLEQRVATLAEHPESEQYLDDYVVLLGDYRIVVEAVTDASEWRKGKKYKNPRVYEDDWRVGTGYNGYVPFIVMDSWHDSHIASQASSSSGVDTGFSSSSFSGGGGSSSW